MQNRYFGDVGDYGKYGLLRVLTGQDVGKADLSLGIVWYLFPDEGHNDDGKHTTYLDKPEFRNCDPDLFDGLKDALAEGRRAVSKIQGLSLLPSGTVFHDAVLSYDDIQLSGNTSKYPRLEYRKRWVVEALRVTADKDIIFLDPDNGIEAKSVTKHAPKGPKYVFWDEIRRFWERDQTLVIYHHLNRTMPSQDQLKIKLAEFSANLSPEVTVIPVLFRRGSLRAFFVLPPPKHRQRIEDRLQALIQSPWSSHMEIYVP